MGSVVNLTGCSELEIVPMHGNEEPSLWIEA